MLTRHLTIVLMILAALTVLPCHGQDLAGSTESKIIALDTQSGARPLVYLVGRLSVDELAALAETAPNVEFLVDLSEEGALAQAGRIQGADAHLLTDAFLAAAHELRWAQSWLVLSFPGHDLCLNCPNLSRSGKSVSVFSMVTCPAA